MKTKFTLAIALSGLMCWGSARAQWAQANTGLTVNDANSFANQGTKLFVSTGNLGGNGTGVFVSTDNGSNWTATNNGLPNTDTKKIISVGSDLFVAMGGNGTNGGVYMSSDNGANWVAKNNGLPYQYAANIAVFNGTLYVTMPAGASRVYTSTDNGANWTAATDPVLMTIAVKSIVSIGGSLLIASDANTEGVFRSTDNGATWSATTVTDHSDCLAIIGSTVFAATATGVYKSADNGVSWTPTANQAGVIDNATALAVIGTTLIVGCPYSVYKSTDNGTSYTDISTGAGGANLSIEAFGMDATYIYIGNTFHPVGVWRRQLTELGVPNGLAFNTSSNTQVYPNPFGEELMIETRDPAGTVAEILSMEGQLVKHIQLSGTTTRVSTDELSPGFYLLKLQNNTGSSVQKLAKN